LEGVKTVSCVEVRLSFLQAWLLQFWCANQSLTIFTHYFSSSYIIHIPNRNTKCYGNRMISLGFGLRGGFMFSSQLKVAKKWKWWYPLRAWECPEETTINLLLLLLSTTKNINWTYYKCYCYLFRSKIWLSWLHFVWVELRFLPRKCQWKN
jgi:hypothetical protein